MGAYFHDIGKTPSLCEIRKYDNFKIIFDRNKKFLQTNSSITWFQIIKVMFHSRKRCGKEKKKLILINYFYIYFSNLFYFLYNIK